jgi:hypothetical protein
MAREDAHIIDNTIEPRRLYADRPIIGAARLLLGSLRDRWHALERGLFFKRKHRVTSPVLQLGAFSGYCTVEEAFDGDLAIDGISGDCKIALESRYGSITIAHKIEHRAQVELKAAKAVTISEGISQYSNVRIFAGGDITIGQMISENSQATITSAAGKIEIGATVEKQSRAKLTAGAVRIGRDIGQDSTAIITAREDVTIDGSINQCATADIISLRGTIKIGQRINGRAIAVLTAGKAIHIGEQISEHSQVTVRAQDYVTIGQKIDQESAVEITSVTGSINIGQGLSDGATATLIAVNGSINIGGSVDRDSTVNWEAREFQLPPPNWHH